MCHTNVRKTASFLSYLNIRGLDTLILCSVEVLHLFEIQKHYKNFAMSSLLTSRQKNDCMRFLVKIIIIQLLLQCIE